MKSGPRSLPAIRDAALRWHTHVSMRPVGFPVTNELAFASAILSENLANATLWWISPEMLSFAAQAAKTVPHFDVLSALPSASGVIAWHPSPGIGPEGHAGAIWCHHQNIWDGLLLDPLCDGALVASAYPELAPHLGALNAPAVVGGVSPEDETAIQRLLYSILTLMQEPSVAETTNASRHWKVRGSKRKATPPTVTLVTLRRPRSQGEHESGSGRSLRYRHLRRGHWHTVRYGEGRANAKSMWFTPTVVGAKLPPRPGDTVSVWRKR